MALFPALNIQGVARVELAARTRAALIREARRIYSAIRAARQASGEKTPDAFTICSLHKPLCNLQWTEEVIWYSWTDHGLILVGE